jgi:hypothetical protein
MPEATQTLPPARPTGFLHDMTQRLRVLETSPPSAANSQATAGPVTGPNLADPPELPPLAKDQDIAAAARLTPALDPIATWLYDGNLNDESILAALQAPSTLQSALLQSTLGRKLQDDDKQHLVDLALANFSHLAFDKIDALVDRLVRDDPKIDPKVRRLVAERLLQHAVHPGAENPRAQARAFALYFARAMRDDPPGMAELLAQLPPQDGFHLARALGKEPLPDNHLTTRLGRQQDPRLNDAKLLCGVRNQILSALPQLAETSDARKAAITAVGYGLWDEITPADFGRTPLLAHHLAVAVADQWDPNNPPVERVEGLLTSPAGGRLMCSGSFGLRTAVREAFRLNPGLSAETLARHGGEPENNPEVAAAITSQLMAGAHGGRVSVPTAEENAGEKLVTDALQTESGRKLLFDPELSPKDRGAVVRIMLADRGKHLTRAAFAGTDDAWQLDGIAGPFAAQKLGNIEDGDFSSLSEIGKSNLAGLWQGKTPANMTEQDIRDAKDRSLPT